eukprot:NODE_1505_length_1392_cov_8.508563_g1250_i0.p5 GENE.NODE_1505_length_1392_cov_8.508563_g1250_i0~~NODE_1505_length_1392_cov_8.508563_g1250_i0.p5  ORF type:complete len:50 (-),score=3.54 NODE_1505_length_1392_cov_8.508563_g1250_i0:521-670(-)
MGLSGPPGLGLVWPSGPGCQGSQGSGGSIQARVCMSWAWPEQTGQGQQQ